MRLPFWKSFTHVLKTRLANPHHHLRYLSTKQHRDHVTDLNQDTLAGRILLYLNVESDKLYQPRQQIVGKPQAATPTTGSNNNLGNLDLNILISYTSNVQMPVDYVTLNKIDAECCTRLQSGELGPEKILQLLTSFMNVASNRMTELRFYNEALDDLCKIHVHDLNKNDFLKLIFFGGLLKKNRKATLMMNECFRLFRKDFVNNLTLEEVCIICNSAFRTSTRINNATFLQKVKDCLNLNLHILKDPALFITLIKTIRHNRCQDDDIISTITCTFFFNKVIEFYKFSGLCHILALYSDYMYYDENIMKVIRDRCLDLLKESTFVSKHQHPSIQVRGKDIKRFIWAMSMFSPLNLIEKSDIENVIMPKLIERVQIGEFKNDPGSLIDIFLYLSILRYTAEELVPYVFCEEKIKSLVPQSPSRQRLNLVLHCIKIENPVLYSKVKSIETLAVDRNDKSVELQMRRRSILNRLLDNLKMIQKQIGLNRFEITREIPFIAYLGITGYKNKMQKSVYLEVLDDFTRIKNVDEDTPCGLMALKLRLLEIDRPDEGLLVISQKEIEDMTEAEFKEYLLDELKIIC